MQQNNSSDFVKVLNDLFKKHGIELPKIADSKGRHAYLDLLDTMGYTETELLPVIERERLTGEMYGVTISALLGAIESNDPKLIKMVGWLAYNTVTGNDNTNLIIAELTNKLLEEFKAIGVTVPSFYAGVFPTDSINAQCKNYNSESLVLIDTGCMEMSEAIVIAFFSKASLHERLKAIELAVESYVESGIRPSPYKVPTQGVNWGSGVVPVITNSYQNFVITHEIGHLVLNHVKSNKVTEDVLRDGKYIDVMSKDEFQEFQADMWAIKTLIECAKQKSDNIEIGIALAGPFMFLCNAMFIEAIYNRKGITLKQDHPKASDRLYMLQLAYELFGVHKSSGIAYSFYEFAKTAIDNCFPEVEPPPFLCRELNQKLIPVLDSLSIDYSNAGFISDFR
jgi:hypothetical protein